MDVLLELLSLLNLTATFRNLVSVLVVFALLLGLSCMVVVHYPLVLVALFDLVSRRVKQQCSWV